MIVLIKKFILNSYFTIILPFKRVKNTIENVDGIFLKLADQSCLVKIVLIAQILHSWYCTERCYSFPCRAMNSNKLACSNKQMIDPHAVYMGNIQYHCYKFGEVGETNILGGNCHRRCGRMRQGQQPAAQRLAACIHTVHAGWDTQSQRQHWALSPLTRAANEVFDINLDQLFKKPQIAMKNPSFKEYNIYLEISVFIYFICANPFKTLHLLQQLNWLW